MAIRGTFQTRNEVMEPIQGVLESYRRERYKTPEVSLSEYRGNLETLRDVNYRRVEDKTEFWKLFKVNLEDKAVI